MDFINAVHFFLLTEKKKEEKTRNLSNFLFFLAISLKVMVFKYLVLEAVADTMAWRDHLLYREVEAGREVFEIYIYKFFISRQYHKLFAYVC